MAALNSKVTNFKKDIFLCREPSPPHTDANGEKRLTPLQLCLENLHRTLQRLSFVNIMFYDKFHSKKIYRGAKSQLDFILALKHIFYSNAKCYTQKYIILG